MKKVSALIVAVVLLVSVACPVFAAIDINKNDLLEINGVYIPVDAECKQEGEAAVYYDFYDPVNDMNYSFYNSVTGEHFAISGPRYVTEGNGARAISKTVHTYSFNCCYTVNGKDNGKTFTLPAEKIYIYGNAQMISAATGENVTSYYDDVGGYEYTIQVKEDVLWFPQSKKFKTVAGDPISGSFEADGGTYYLIITPNSRMEDWHRIKGSGELYYYG